MLTVIDQVKPYIEVWTASTSDCPQLLISGEVDMCLTANGRFSDAILAGEPLAITWDAGHLLDTFPQAIPKGLRQQDPEMFELAQLLIAWLSFPENNVLLAKYIAYAPINEESWILLDNPEYADQRPWLPTSTQNVQYSYLPNEEWVTEVNEEQSNRYFEWLGE